MKHRHLVTRLCFCLFFAISAHAESDPHPAPRPRKRLGAESAREVKQHNGDPVVGNVQTMESQFTHTFSNYVITSFNQMTARLPEEPVLNEACDIKLKWNTETHEVMDVKITGKLSEHRRLLLLEAISKACKVDMCPMEMKKKYGKILEIRFGMIANNTLGRN